MRTRTTTILRSCDAMIKQCVRARSVPVQFLDTLAHRAYVRACVARWACLGPRSHARIENRNRVIAFGRCTLYSLQ